MNQVRFGIIGLGTMGSIYARAIYEGKIPQAVLGAVCDPRQSGKVKFPDVPTFDEANALMESGTVDAVVVATPHFAHTTCGIAALEAGLHVLVEKPISVHKADAEKLLAAHQSDRQVFAAMFNQRTDPLYARLRELIRGGELGALRRIQWTVTDWFRSQAYYDSGTWRATWRGEGGGVLLNQAPHNLDLWQWLFGMPAEVRAFATTGRYHAIEVEDDVTAFLRYPDGTTGVFTTSTGEAPGTNRLEVAAERGRVVVEGGRLTFTRNVVPASEYSRTTTLQFQKPEVWEIDIPISGRGPQHNGILTNFVEAILDSAPLLSPAAEGIHSVELANAMILSALENETVTLPMNSARYERFLAQKIAGSKLKPGPIPPTAAASDFAKSF